MIALSLSLKHSAIYMMMEVWNREEYWCVSFASLHCNTIQILCCRQGLDISYQAVDHCARTQHYIFFFLKDDTTLSDRSFPEKELHWINNWFRFFWRSLRAVDRLFRGIILFPCFLVSVSFLLQHSWLSSYFPAWEEEDLFHFFLKKIQQPPTLKGKKQKEAKSMYRLFNAPGIKCPCMDGWASQFSKQIYSSLHAWMTKLPPSSSLLWKGSSTSSEPRC